jgi:hypothetical protein
MTIHAFTHSYNIDVFSDNLSDAPSASTYMSSVLQSGKTSTRSVAGSDWQSSREDNMSTSTTEGSDAPVSHIVKTVSGTASTKARTKTRISEATAKYIEWPLPEVKRAA